MELNFDKEMDALLRQAARSGEVVSTNAQSHLDADEISAFAENALPEKTRGVYIKHFADCNRCRTILSNTILLNAEAENEAASSAVIATTPEIVATQIPWYRKIFLMPNLAYTMGALVLAVGGMFGFLVLQNISQYTASEVSQVGENESKASGPNVGDEGILYNSNAATVSNSTANAANMSASNSANTSAAVSNSAVSVNPAENADGLVSPANTPVDKLSESDSTDTTVRDEDQMLAKRKNNKDVSDSSLAGSNLPQPEEKLSDDRKAKEEAVLKSVPAAPAKPPPPAVASSQAENEKNDNVARAKKSERRDTGFRENTRQISGKTFNRVNGVWIDSAYNKSLGTNMGLPPTRNIRRGSDEYRKLDKQVRIIAESLEGPVIIVWKDGAYRIQ